MPVEAARAALGLPDRRLAEALAAGAPGVTMTEGYLRPARITERLPDDRRSLRPR